MIYLSSSQSLPLYLKQVNGVKWHQVQSQEEIQSLLTTLKGDIHVVVRTDSLSLRTVQAFLAWGQLKLRLHFVFIADKIEKAVYQQSLHRDSQVLVLRETEAPHIAQIITQRVLGAVVKSRRQERQETKSPVMLKKSAFAEESPIGAWMQLLREGEMMDFSQGGAQITVLQSGVQAKDFVSLMYRDHRGSWISVESQVRWVKSSSTGTSLLGLQFLAVSA